MFKAVSVARALLVIASDLDHPRKSLLRRPSLSRSRPMAAAVALIAGLGTLASSAAAQVSETDLQIGQARAGQSYAVVRRHLIAAGLAPVPQTDPDRCSGRQVCKVYPEAENCLGTGTGACSFVFREPDGRYIIVSTLGDERGAPGRELGLDLLVQGLDAAPPDYVKYLTDNAAAAATKTPSAPPGQNAPKPISAAMRVWSITLNKAPNGTLFCEVAMRGRNAEAGGDYAIRFRIERGSAPVLILTYARPRLVDVPGIALTLDGRPIGGINVRPSRLNGVDALVAAIDSAWFSSKVTPELLKPTAFGLTIMAGGRLFQAPVQGWNDVMDNLDSCTDRLAE